MLPSGGVCAVLDYEIDQITEYVASMAQQLILPGTPVSPAFRKFVSGLLSSTRLPSTTILLGMNYLARRINLLNAAGPYKATDGVVWRMLTIGLLLGSKFLDDNTFQNRSWSEVSGITVTELNTMESEWLQAMSWSLYVNLDESQDFKAWIQNWNEWREKKNRERKATLDRLAPLAPIDTNVQRPRPYSQTYSGYTKSASQPHPDSGFHSAQSRSAFDQLSWVNAYPTPQHTPPSAPDSAVHTPEYMSATGGAPRYNDWALFNQQPRVYQQPYHPHLAYLGGQNYSAAYGYHNCSMHPMGLNPYDGSLMECQCHNCISPIKQPYFMTHGHGYGQQIAA